jgi:hypothetical protein
VAAFWPWSEKARGGFGAQSKLPEASNRSKVARAGALHAATTAHSTRTSRPFPWAMRPFDHIHRAAIKLKLGYHMEPLGERGGTDAAEGPR